MMLPISEPAPASGRRTIGASEGPETEQRDAGRRDAERDGDDQDEHDQRHDRVPQGHDQASEDQPDQVEQDPHGTDCSPLDEPPRRCPRGPAPASDALRRCEHTFVTSQGHAYSRFRRALLTKNVTLIDAAARELQHVALDDALRTLVVLAERQDRRFERAAARFGSRVTTERRLSLAEARYVLALAEALPRSRMRSRCCCARTAADRTDGAPPRRARSRPGRPVRHAAHLLCAHASSERDDAAGPDVDVVHEVHAATVGRPVAAADGHELARHDGLNAIEDDAREALEDERGVFEHGAPATPDASARQGRGRRPPDVLVEDIGEATQVTAQPRAVELVDGLTRHSLW